MTPMPKRAGRRTAWMRELRLVIGWLAALSMESIGGIKDVSQLQKIRVARDKVIGLVTHVDSTRSSTVAKFSLL